jgi:hypothetical protein
MLRGKYNLLLNNLAAVKTHLIVGKSLLGAGWRITAYSFHVMLRGKNNLLLNNLVANKANDTVGKSLLGAGGRVAWYGLLDVRQLLNYLLFFKNGVTFAALHTACKTGFGAGSLSALQDNLAVLITPYSVFLTITAYRTGRACQAVLKTAGLSNHRMF